MIKLQTLSCPNCTAPLHPQEKQTLVACLYCNSTIRLSYAGQSQPAAATMPNISPDVVDEVKRLLILGLRTKAVTYYANAVEVSEADAAAAVATIHKSIAYAPPLSRFGLFVLIVAIFMSLAGLWAGARMLLSWRQPGTEPLIALVLIVFGLFNVFIFGRGLPGYLLEWRGQPAQATIAKSWPIRTFMVRGRNAYLRRFLLEIHLPQQPPYQTEANGVVSEESLPKFQIGSQVNVKVDPANRQRVVIIGPVGSATG